MRDQMQSSHFWQGMRRAMRTFLQPGTDAVAISDIPGREGGRAKDHRPQRSLFLFLLLGLMAVLSFYSIATQSLWLDEAGSVAIARLGWSELLLPMLTSDRANMAFYYVLLHCWLRFGTGEFAVRSMSAFMAVAALVPLYGVGGLLFGENVGLIA